MPRTSLSILCSAVAVLLVSGCGGMMTLRRDLETLGRAGTAHVELVNHTGRQSPHVVVLFDVETKKLDNFSILHGSGEVVMAVPPGRYYLGAYEDRNENLEYDPDEPATIHGGPDAIEISDAQRVDLELELRDGETFNAEERALVADLRTANPELTINHVDDIVPLSDARFDPKYGNQGMWEPTAFIASERHGLYMLEAYDPARTPILFVHGIGATPRDFAGMVESIDRSKFQAWMFFYPSALRLGVLARYLNKSMEVMRTKYGPAKIILVAHSMGGLVATEAVQSYFQEGAHDDLCLFVTIASPLGGMPSAGSGVAHSPVVMPCWYDLAPGSDFLKKLYRADSGELPYYMVFAYRRSGFTAPSGDGVVPLTSQLRAEAQDRARRLIGVDAGHVDVLSDPMSLRSLNRLFVQYGAPTH